VTTPAANMQTLPGNVARAPAPRGGRANAPPMWRSCTMVKAVFEKVGVSSRGELAARVFADHWAPVSHLETDAAG
jgi:hypothetical protein